MMRSDDVERFAARLRALKDRAGISFEEMAKQTGTSRSSLHRYCSAAKIPTGYGVVHAFAKTCGASSEELRELHRLWALADATRTAAPSAGQATTSAETASTVDSDQEKDQEDDQRNVQRNDQENGPRVEKAPPEPARSRIGQLALGAITLLVLVTGVIDAVALVRVADNTDASASSTGQPDATAAVRVFNIDEGCQRPELRLPGCSLALAANPRLSYDATNVVSHRVWHGEVLEADCVLYNGDGVKDMTGASSTRWFRIRLSDVPGGVAWLPAIHTRDNPPLPTCIT